MPTVAILTSLFFPYGKKDVPIVYSGADRYLRELCRLFKRKGWSVLILQAVDEYWETEYEGCTVRGIPGTEFDFETNPVLNRVFNETALSADLRIYFAPFVCYPQVTSPCISICHGIWWDYPGHSLSNGPDNFRKEYFRRVEFGLTSCDATVCVDTAVMEFVRATWPGKDKGLRYVPNFVDTNQFSPRQEPKDWERPRVLYPRRLTTLRGSNEFLWAVKELPEVDFWMVGHGDEQTDEKLLTQICATHNNLTWLKKSFDEMPDIYRQVDLAVIPTRAAEGTSLSALEAMATGLPLITTTIGGLPNLLIDGYNGVFVDLYSERLHNVIRALLARPEYMAGLGKRGREMAEAAFDIQIWRAKWWQIINAVIQ